MKVNVTSEVIYTKHLVSTISKYRSSILTKDEVQRIYRVIKDAGLKDANVKMTHVKKIRNEMAGKSNKVAKNECPKCVGY